LSKKENKNINFGDISNNTAPVHIGDIYNSRDAEKDSYPVYDLPPINPKIKLPKYPFKGLQWFKKEDAGIFFGREKAIKNFFEKLEKLDNSIFLLYGQSGVGKSSFLNAGIIPRIDTRYNVFYTRISEQEDFYKEVRIGFKKQTVDKKPFLVIIDQIDWFFSSSKKSTDSYLNGLNEFLRECLHNHPKEEIKFVLSFRKEFLAEIKSSLDEYSFSYNGIFLNPLDKEGIVNAIRGISTNNQPKLNYNLQIEEGLIETITADISRDEESHVAPALQVLLTNFWELAIEENRNNPQFTKDSYRENFKKTGVLLDNFLEQQLEIIESKQETSVGLTLDILHYLTTDLATAKEVLRDRLNNDYSHIVNLNSLILQLKNAQLISDGKADNSKTNSIRLAHDALAPLIIRRFNNSNLSGQNAKRILNNKIKFLGKLPESTLDSIELKEVVGGEMGMKKWTKEELKLIKKSKQKNQKDRLAKIGGAILVIVLIVALFFLFKSWKSQKIAKKEQLKKEKSTRFTYLASQFIDINPIAALKFAEKAIQVDSNNIYGRKLLSDIYGIFNTNAIFESKFKAVNTIITEISVSQDGRRLLIGDNSAKAHLFNLKGEKLLELQNHNFFIKEVNFLNKEMLLTGGTNGLIEIWDLGGNRTSTIKIKTKGSVLDYDLNVKRNELLVSSNTQLILVDLNNEKQKIIATFENYSLNSGAIFPDGQQIISGHSDGFIRLWSKTGTLLNQYKTKRGSTTNVVISPKGNYFAFGDGNRIIKIYTRKGELLSSFQASIKSLSSFTFSPNEAYLLTSCMSEKKRTLWRLNGEKVIEFKGESTGSSAVFLSDHKIVGGEADGNVKIWNFKGNKEVSLSDSIYSSMPVIMTRDGKKLISAAKDSLIRITDLATNTTESFFFSGLITNLYNLPSQQGFFGRTNKNQFFAFDFAGNSIPFLDNKRQFGRITDTNISASGRKLLISTDNQTYFIDIVSKKEFTFDRGKGNFISVDFSFDDTKILLGEAGGVIQVRDTLGNLLTKLNGKNGNSGTMRVSPTANQILTGGTDGTVTLIDFLGNEITSFRTHSASVSSLEFSSDGSSILSVAGYQGEVYVNDLSGRELFYFKADTDNVRNAVFSNDNQYIITTGSEGIRIWYALEELLKRIKGNYIHPYFVKQYPEILEYVLENNDLTIILEYALFYQIESQRLQNSNLLAKKFFEESLNIPFTDEQPQLIANMYGDLSYLQLRAKKNKEALASIKRAIEIDKPTIRKNFKEKSEWFEKDNLMDNPTFLEIMKILK